ncbi:P-loop containing nucleoside triphosphate hydrolase protein [Schizophyllum commune H4-8]|uniref:P-loop containing nucleoside triphosphate hydrolase protein n=1 Tax=Schizophyllum commune (strain H4-8 / FGSC 9210) TaxID=578458 RepID=UPI0021600DF5|nr:P-loop containing nucleoside triphosphate hydrolase protein [Schizophyllum commune H4-8]KAI5886823.1 P-loop containing nucleoside triphosphate hydrolase protein [Schizophyllum commune H4-8]
MTLMTTDVDRVSEFAWHLFSLIDSPIEIVIGSWFLYDLLGPSCFVGLAATLAFLPMNHFAGKIVVSAQDNLMRARDERVALMNEVLGAIRMLKFMAWERSFEARVLRVREKELKYQRMNYVIETLWNAIWNGSPILVTLVAFWHYSVLRGQPLGPATAFTSIMVFTEMNFALNALPETFINMLQSLVSLRRIEKYLGAAEVKKLEGLGPSALPAEPTPIELRSCTLTWPQERASTSTGLEASTTSTTLPGLSTPRPSFILQDVTLSFPPGALSLVCGKLGSGKTLLLLGLLGEADVLAGQLSCPRSPPDALAVFAKEAEEKGSIAPESWIVPGVCAYVPQAAWLRNASIKDNILFSLPYDEARYTAVLDACALTADLDVLEDGDAAEIGERGVNLSGGQKARVSLARAVYSRAETLLLDDVLSAVDAHTAQHLFARCLRGPLMDGRTVVLVSHHVQLCVGGGGRGRRGAEYVVALDNGRVRYAGGVEGFRGSGVMAGLVQAVDAVEEDEKEELAIEGGFEGADEAGQGVRPSELKTAPQPAPAAPAKARKPPRKLVEEEKRAVGRIGKDIWLTYFKACGDKWYWAFFVFVFVVSALSPVAENGWLRYWSAQELTPPSERKSAGYYIGIYAAVALAGLVVTTLRWFSLYGGSIHASRVLYKRLLESVLFANIRFHDTVSRGRVLNRFGKDFEGIDSSLSDNFGRTAMYSLSTATTIITVSVVGGPPFVAAALVIGFFYYQVGKVYGQTSRDMRRLDSVTRSPLYSLYGETISGVTILRAFGASTKFMRDMLRCVDTNANPYYWMWGVNRWLSVRFNLLSSAVVGVTAVVVMLTPRIDAAFAGFALAFANSITGDLLFMVRRFVGLEQSMVALERVKEYSELKREAPEFVEPRPPAAWPERGEINVEDLVIQYAPELPPVLHGLTFSVKPGEKVAVLGRTGSGKSTLALSFFRFVEATQGKIFIDGLDIAKVGLTDLRSRLTIIPQDPTILSGTLRSTLDVFEEYEDAEIYEALRRVHLIPSENSSEPIPGDINVNVFRNLDGVVSEGGENFSTGEKQLLCMARAILKRSKVLFMDEATASVDYATDELIGKTIRQEFADSTILTIAHRLRTVIDYDRVMLLDNGRIAEFDSPATLLRDTSSKFYSLCKATGKEEFAMLKKLAGA